MLSPQILLEARNFTWAFLPVFDPVKAAILTEWRGLVTRTGRPFLWNSRTKRLVLGQRYSRKSMKVADCAADSYSSDPGANVLVAKMAKIVFERSSWAIGIQEESPRLI